MISSDKRQWIVVTSDRDIAGHAWAKGSVVVSSGEFLNVIERRGRIEAGEFEPLDEEEYELPKKGSPRRLSKKEKVKKRALGKL